jgi:serine/threonine protein kinase
MKTNVYLNSGYILGRYTIRKKISSGGFGVVYDAYENINGKKTRVAIKEFLPTNILCRPILNNGEVKVVNEDQTHRFNMGLKNFFTEADTLAKIKTSHVVPVLDVFKQNNTGYFVMPLEKGYTLHQWLKSDPSFSDWKIQQIFIQAAQGLIVLHEYGLLHLDIKPSNLWVRPNGEIVVLDLGASWWANDSSRKQHAARTPGFAAPEQHGKPTKIPDQRTDVYGLGASMYACISGAPPSPAMERNEKDLKLSQLLLGKRNNRLLELVDKSLELDKEKRFNTIQDLYNILVSIPNLKKKYTIDYIPEL